MVTPMVDAGAAQVGADTQTGATVIAVLPGAIACQSQNWLTSESAQLGSLRQLRSPLSPAVSRCRYAGSTVARYRVASGRLSLIESPACTVNGPAGRKSISVVVGIREGATAA